MHLHHQIKFIQFHKKFKKEHTKENKIQRQGIFVETDNNLKAVNVKKGLKSSTMTKVSIF